MPHALIIDGGGEQSRKNLALFLAMWAVCGGKDRPCGQCKNCKNARAQAHSDIYFVKGEGKTDSYSINEVKKVVRDAFIKPNQAQYKVYIFNECDRRFPEASQNVFLKTLEEPPGNVLFIMTCRSGKSLLETIRSRATVFTLESTRNIDQDKLALAREIALGIVSPLEMELLKALYRLDKRDSALETLDLVILILRDGLAIACGSTAETDAETAEKLCRKLTKAQYIRLIEATQSAETKIVRNVGLKLLGTQLCGEYRRIAWQR